TGAVTIVDPLCIGGHILVLVGGCFSFLPQGVVAHVLGVGGVKIHVALAVDYVVFLGFFRLLRANSSAADGADIAGTGVPLCLIRADLAFAGFRAVVGDGI